jgi:hypothetical protein
MREGLLRSAALCLAVFLAVTLIAWALGAANLGTAATFGQLAFVAMLAYVIIAGRD